MQVGSGDPTPVPLHHAYHGAPPPYGVAMERVSGIRVAGGIEPPPESPTLLQCVSPSPPLWGGGRGWGLPPRPAPSNPRTESRSDVRSVGVDFSPRGRRPGRDYSRAASVPTASGAEPVSTIARAFASSS